MAGHELIAAQIAVLARRLPAPAVEELSDGLEETYEAHLAELGDPDAAARAALAAFGDAETIAAAFVRASPWRRTARALLATGPLMAVIWAATLIAGQAWTWPIPWPVKLAFGVTLTAVAALLATAGLARGAYRRGRAATLAGMAGLVVLDGLMVTAALAAAGWAWPTAAAISASVIRMVAAARALPAARAA
ncbi:hypothetical protein [Nonomuraea rubra]|uniref:hypothetical protein n=1 Tax=Nonomuraea rubra TaxID=46180 RepID=UPI0033C201F4